MGNNSSSPSNPPDRNTGNNNPAARRDDPPGKDSIGPKGGQSGNGQANPHHGRNYPRDADGPDLQDDQSQAETEPTGPTYQSGGTNEDRAQKDEERKTSQSRGGPTGGTGSGGGPDPAPGQELDR